VSAVHRFLRGIDAPRDRPGRDRLADRIAKVIAADRRFSHRAAADEQIMSARNMTVHKWIISGLSPQIAAGFGDELAARVVDRLAELRAAGPP
jgi:hypothetical protein